MQAADTKVEKDSFGKNLNFGIKQEDNLMKTG
jgi:hypothetical protein